MTAEVLRRASSLMRERAEAATAGPWLPAREGLQGGEVVRSADQRVARAYACQWPDYPPTAENAEHIASWHPAVALAVADWLDVVAGYGEPQPGRGTRNWDAALDAARAYLGESS